MAGRFFGIPFAATGDRTATPDAVQPDGSVSYSEGFGFDYERPNTDPAYKPVPRDGMNGLFFDLTEAMGIVQKQGFADWTTDAQPYAINAAVRHNDVNWYSLIATNNDEPGVGPGATSWKVLGASGDTLNAPIATVAAAGTINLTTGAPDTSQLVISGTGVSINGFTVAANRVFLVKMTGANTLVNSASLVTQTGGNIETLAGDSFWMRATSANTVEILTYARVQRLTQSAVVNTTSGTSHDITGIPSWVRKVTVIIDRVSLNSADQLLVRVGDGSVLTSGYTSNGGSYDAGSGALSSTTGFIIRTVSAAGLATVAMTLHKVTGNEWISTHVGSTGTGTGTSTVCNGGGSVSLSGDLDRVRLTSVTGTSVFDAGKLTVQYEG